MGNLLLILTTVLSAFLANLENKTLQSDFTVTVSEEVNAPMNFPGSLTMQGNCFRLTMFGMDAAYDGKTLYIYTSETDELTMTNPTEDELVQSNPFMYARALTDVCHIVERASQDGKQTTITLTPKDQSIGINRFMLRVRNEDLIPLQAEIKEGKKISTLKMKEPKFVTTPQEYKLTPGKETFINDMRL